MRGPVPVLVFASAAALLTPWSSRADAAVRSCRAAVASEITQADTELIGKRKALISWTTRAAKLGPGYTSWQMADKKVLGCKKSKAPGSGYQCIAYAAPCTVNQVPGAPVPGKPKRRTVPTGSKAPFEV